MHLTKRIIEALQYQGPEPRKDIRWHDCIPGFGVRVFPSGRKTFALSFRHQARKRLMKIGAFGVLTLEQARDRARAKLVALTDGVDPLAERQREARGETVKDLAEAYLERDFQAALWRLPKTISGRVQYLPDRQHFKSPRSEHHRGIREARESTRARSGNTGRVLTSQQRVRLVSDN
jgi:hypothetical protein